MYVGLQTETIIRSGSGVHYASLVVLFKFFLSLVRAAAKNRAFFSGPTTKTKKIPFLYFLLILFPIFNKTYFI